MSDKTKIFKFIFISNFLLFTIALIVLSKIPLEEYEPSIYNSIPLVVWILLLTSVTITISMIIYTLYLRSKNFSFVWKVGYIYLFLIYSFILSLHIIRGYYMYAMIGDPSAHIGVIDDILTSKHLPENLIYPILHVYAVEFIHLTGTDLILLHKYLPLIFGLLSVPFLFVFSKSVLIGKKKQIILAGILCFSFSHSWYLNFTPNHLSVLFFPIVLFAIVKSFFYPSFQWRFIAIIFAILYPPFHQVPTFSILITIFGLFLADKFLPLNARSSINANKKLSIYLFLILFVWGVSWISSFYQWDYTIRNIYALANEDTPTHISSLSAQIENAAEHGFSVVEYILRTNISAIIYISLIFLSMPIVINKSNMNKKSHILPSLYLPMILMLVATIALFFLNLMFGPTRLLFYFIILGTPFIGIILNRLLLYKNIGMFIASILISLILIFSTLGAVAK